MEAQGISFLTVKRELLAMYEDLQNKAENLNKGLSFKVACFVASEVFTIPITEAVWGGGWGCI